MGGGLGEYFLPERIPPKVPVNISVPPQYCGRVGVANGAVVWYNCLVGDDYMFFKKMRCPMCSQKVSKNDFVCENCGYTLKEEPQPLHPPLVPYIFRGVIFLDSENGNTYDVTNAVVFLKAGHIDAASAELWQTYRMRPNDKEAVIKILQDAIDNGTI